MKKLLLLSITFVILSGMIIAGTINVTSPRAGVTWIKGSSYNITWTASRCVDTNFKINIFRNSVSPENFVEQLTTSEAASKRWTVPAGYTNGNYVIRVKTADNLCSGDSGVFTISSASSPSASITVTSPDTGSIWLSGTPRIITWTKSGTMNANVKINIFKGSINPANFVEQLTAPNSGSVNWTVPSGYIAGIYRIRIKTADGEVTGDSPFFEIVQTEANSSCYSILMSRRIQNRDEWTHGSTMRIDWGYLDNYTPCAHPRSIKITLRNEANTETVKLIKLSARGNSYSWAIPATIYPGRYRIRLSVIGASSVSVASNPFTINGLVSLVTPLDLRLIDLSGRITDTEVKVAYMKPGFRWRIKFKIRISHSPENTNLNNFPITYSINKVGGTERYTRGYVIEALSGGGEHVQSINLTCGDDKYKTKSPRLEEGDYYIEVWIDPQNTTRDRNLRNNKFRWNFTLVK
ncbi:MAG: Ser-Thr-rich GPI-anchored membrane family protein [Acidobacteriota bacterium]